MKKIIFILFTVPLIMFSQTNYNLSLVGDYSWSNTEGSDIWGWVDPVTEKEYALVGLNDGFSVVNVSNPSNPIEMFYISDINSTWRDIKTWGNYAYVTTEADAGLLIVDLTDMTGNTFWHVSSFNHPSNGSSVEFTAAHNIYIDENGIAYIFGASSNTGSSPSDGAIFLDVNANSIAPEYLGEWDDQYIHDGMVRGDTLYAGCIYTGELYIIDVSNKNNPTTMGTHPTPNLFTHNAWVSDNGDFVFTTDEESDSYIGAYNITNISNIQEVDRIQSNPGSNSIPHNTHVDGNFLVTSWYRDGTTIHDATYPNNMIQVGYYDSYSGSGDGFQGCWGTYPFLPSGLIISSDIDSGPGGGGRLLVYERGFNQACYLEGTVTDALSLLPISGASIDILNTNLPNNTSSNLSGNYFSGTADAAAYNIVFSKPGYLTDTISASLVNGVITVLDVALEPLVSFTASGMVIDVTTANGIANADVVIYNNDFTFNVTTDANGNFEINSMYEGSYDLIAGQWGYITSCNNEYVDGSLPITITLEEGYYDDFTFDFGWTVNGGASAGMWERGLSEVTNNQGQDFNPDGDVNNDCMDFSYATGINAGSQTGSNDVDDANTILTSPIFDLSSNQDYILRYYSWFSNGGGGWGGGSPANDSLTVSISNGSTSVPLEIMTVNSPDMGQWNSRSFNLAQYLPLTSTMYLMIETADWDALGGHWVEGGFDKFEILNITPTINEELLSSSKGNVVKVVDVLGREISHQSKSLFPLFYIYENGVVEKKVIIR